jgi:hypothetical protein
MFNLPGPPYPVSRVCRDVMGHRMTAVLCGVEPTDAVAIALDFGGPMVIPKRRVATWTVNSIVNRAALAGVPPWCRSVWPELNVQRQRRVPLRRGN